VQRGDERGELLLRHVLEFVDEDREGRVRSGRRRGRRLEQRLQVVLEVTVVGEPCLRFLIEADLDVLVLHLERLGEAGERPQAALREIGRARLTREPQEREAQLRREDGRQGPVLRRLDADHLDSRRGGLLAHAIQQHRLAHAAKPDHEDALRRPTDPSAGDRDPDRLDQLVAAGELRGWGTGARCERIADGIHVLDIPIFVSLCKSHNQSNIDISFTGNRLRQLHLQALSPRSGPWSRH
jgi:hypothetical protein